MDSKSIILINILLLFFFQNCRIINNAVLRNKLIKILGLLKVMVIINLFLKRTSLSGLNQVSRLCDLHKIISYVKRVTGCLVDVCVPFLYAIGNLNVHLVYGLDWFYINKTKESCLCQASSIHNTKHPVWSMHPASFECWMYLRMPKVATFVKQSR